MLEQSTGHEFAHEAGLENRPTPPLTTREKLRLQVAVMKYYLTHHDEKHPGLTDDIRSMNWVEHGAAKAFQELLDEVELSSEDIRQVEQVKALTRKGDLAEATHYCHELLSKKFAVENSLESEV